MPETGFWGWMHRRAAVVVPLSAVLLVVGVGMGVVGLTAASSADEDLVEAEAALADAEDQRDEAEADVEAAEARVEEAVSGAEGSLGAATQIVDAGTELCNCDQQLSDLAEQSRQAALAQDAAGYNALLGELDSWALQANDMDQRIDDLINQVVVVDREG
jgi:hypothetical protein